MLPWLIQEGTRWVQSQRDEHRPGARPLDDREVDALERFFVPTIPYRGSIGHKSLGRHPVTDDPISPRAAGAFVADGRTLCQTRRGGHHRWQKALVDWPSLVFVRPQRLPE